MRRLLLPTLLVGLLLSAGEAAARDPNDPAWREQWAQRHIGMPAVWDVTTGHPGIVIATVDTGANALPDLADALVPGWDFVDNDPFPQDTQGHGTQVASVIAARGDNGIGMAGHCWRCKVMPVRVSRDGSATPDMVAAGVRWATQHGARIINISFSRKGGPDAAEYEAVRAAVDAGVIVVASAGNSISGTNLEQLHYPAAYPGVLSVGASNDFDELYFWSIRGSWVPLSAPGCQMVLDPVVVAGTLCGTSFTPSVVSGVAALLLSQNPGLTHYQVIAALASTAKPVRGVTAGRVAPLEAMRSLGLALPVNAAPAGSGSNPPTSQPQPQPQPKPKAAPRVRYVHETALRRGILRGSRTLSLDVGAGRVDAQFVAPRARECFLTLQRGGELHVSLPAVGNILSLTATVAGGRWTLDVACSSARARAYTLAVTARFAKRRR